MERGVDLDFIIAMQKGLRHGRSQGRTWWEQQFIVDGVTPMAMLHELKKKFTEELNELTDAIEYGAPASEVLDEAADVANMAMMIAHLYQVQLSGV